MDNDLTDPALANILSENDVTLRIGLSRCRDLVAECREKLVANPLDPPSDDAAGAAATDQPPG